MSAEKKKQMGVLGLVVALVVTLFGSLLFVGAVGGWFDGQKVTLDPEYYGEGAEFMELSADEYEQLIEAKKSFVVFVDQDGCTTADRLREYMTKYMTETGISVYKMMFAEVKESSLHEVVKYYPTVAMISRGHVVGFLRADVDEDARFYNNYEDFREWMGRYL
ncbi:MAG: hypothetical protein Q4F56_00325 [Candidatus Saccharibacteria bacterium]|nr:hypothetical protein [Candidatus Saccharibacteria bacterium]